MGDKFLAIVILGLASGVVSTTVTQSKIFAPLRRFVYRWSDTETGWFGKLISCPYCFGHWVAGVLAIYNHMFVAWLSITAVSVIVSGIIGRLYRDE